MSFIKLPIQNLSLLFLFLPSSYTCIYPSVSVLRLELLLLDQYTHDTNIQYEHLLIAKCVNHEPLCNRNKDGIKNHLIGLYQLALV